MTQPETMSELDQLVVAARMGVEFIDHWVSQHSMNNYPPAGSLRDRFLAYPGSAREAAEYIRRALTPYQHVARKLQPAPFVED